MYINNNDSHLQSQGVCCTVTTFKAWDRCGRCHRYSGCLLHIDVATADTKPVVSVVAVNLKHRPIKADDFAKR